MTYRHLVLDLDRSRHIATVTLNKPERLNAIDQNDKVDLLDAIARIQSDDDIWVAIWTGAGRGFCSGADLQGPPPDDGNKPLNELLDEESWISRQGKALYGVDKPMIAAVNGVAAGAGFSLALACDMRVGCPDSRFVTVFQERSLPPEGGMSFPARAHRRLEPRDGPVADEPARGSRRGVSHRPARSPGAERSVAQAPRRNSRSGSATCRRRRCA
jgi:2-(1,2-epoxy-1,2-dihydrophenyl)acetyl-CoA isomerase